MFNAALKHLVHHKMCHIKPIKDKRDAYTGSHISSLMPFNCLNQCKVFWGF